jgi:predicted nuclease of predicted toxin-antitoxin system
MYKIFVDENIPLISVLELKRKGFEIIDVRGTGLEGISDEEVWNIAQQKQCLLITTDKSFSKKRFKIIMEF